MHRNLICQLLCCFCLTAINMIHSHWFHFFNGSDDNLSEDDMNECVKEDALEGEDNDAQQSEHVKKKNKKTNANIAMRYHIINVFFKPT